MEEIVRGIIGLLSKHSGGSIRGKFSRMKEIMSIITDSSATALSTSNFHHLTAVEIAAFSSLRLF